MGYCSLTDLKNYLPEATIIQLTDDADTGDVDLDKTNDAIRRADDFIDAHLQGRYPLPLTSVPVYIRDVSTKLAIYFLYKRSLAITLPDVIKEDYDYCVGVLQKIQMGKVNPFQSGQEPVFFNSNKTDADRVFVTVSTPTGNMFTPSTLPSMVSSPVTSPNQINLNNYIL
jgi:phage gp36-like protein